MSRYESTNYTLYLCVLFPCIFICVPPSTLKSCVCWIPNIFSKWTHIQPHPRCLCPDNYKYMLERGLNCNLKSHDSHHDFHALFDDFSWYSVVMCLKWCGYREKHWFSKLWVDICWFWDFCWPWWCISIFRGGGTHIKIQWNSWTKITLNSKMGSRFPNKFD